MNKEQTRQLGIEFERRVQTMIPEKEYLDKLDTDTIYAYLNSYQDRYIHDIYRNLDQIKSGSKLSAHVEAILQSMLKTQTISVSDGKNYTQDITDPNGLTIIENGRSVIYPLDPSFYMYVRSVSEVSSTYSFKGTPSSIRIIPNELVSQSDVWRLLETPHNSLRILRYPAATIGAYESFGVYKTITVTNDNMTNPKIFSVESATSTDVINASASICHQYSDLSRIVTLQTGYNSLQDILQSVSGLPIGQDISNTLSNLSDNDYCFLIFVYQEPGASAANVHYYRVYKHTDNEYSNENIKILKTQFPEGFESAPDDYTVTCEYDGTTTQVVVDTDSNQDYYILTNQNSEDINKGSVITIAANRDAVSGTVPTLNVIYDRYTTPVGVKVMYYAQPRHFDIMTSTPCELPMDAFDDLVTGAVDLYVQYVAGAEANKRRLEEARRQQQKDENKRRRNEDED